MPDYSKGKIYKLHILGNDELIYYGSTTTKLSDRIAKHRAKFKRWKNGKSHYITSFKLFENEGVVITLVENFPCNSKYELEAKERFYIENNKCVNRYIPTRSQKEYQKADKYKQYKKEYQKTDKYKEYRKEYEKLDKRKQRKKEYNKEKIKCEFCSCSVRKNNLKRHHKSIKCKKFQNTISSQ